MRHATGSLTFRWPRFRVAATRENRNLTESGHRRRYGMELSALLLFAGALLLAAGTPGPSIAALVAQVLARGGRPALPFLLAMWVGEADRQSGVSGKRVSVRGDLGGRRIIKKKTNNK